MVRRKKKEKKDEARSDLEARSEEFKPSNKKNNSNNGHSNDLKGNSFLSIDLEESIKATADKENKMTSEDESETRKASKTEKSAVDAARPQESIIDALPSSYEIEYRTRVRFPAPEILAAAAEIGEKVAALEADLANIKQLVAVIQEKIAKGFDVTESSSAIYSSGEAAAGLEILGIKKTSEAVDEEEEPEELDDAFMTLL